MVLASTCRALTQEFSSLRDSVPWTETLQRVAAVRRWSRHSLQRGDRWLSVYECAARSQAHCALAAFSGGPVLLRQRILAGQHSPPASVAGIRGGQRRKGHSRRRIAGRPNVYQEQDGTMGSNCQPIPLPRGPAGSFHVHSVSAGKEEI
jgi:hypothetical protein